MGTPERRRFFRINDWVGLSYKPIERRESEDPAREAANLQIGAAELLRGIDKEINESLGVLWQNNAIAASLLGLINRKIDILAGEIDLGYNDKGKNDELVRVNLSACGIAFEADEHFNAGQELELFVTLKPINKRLKLNALVVGSALYLGEGEKNYLIRAEFENTDTPTQEELIQHIVKRQSGQLAIQRSAAKE